MQLPGFLRKDNGHAAAKSLLCEVRNNISLLERGQAPHVGVWQSIVAAEQISTLGDAAYAAQLAYDGVTKFNGALVLYHQCYTQRPKSQPPPAPGEREAYEGSLASQRTLLLEQLTELKKDLQARVGS